MPPIIARSAAPWLISRSSCAIRSSRTWASLSRASRSRSASRVRGCGRAAGRWFRSARRGRRACAALSPALLTRPRRQSAPQSRAHNDPGLLSTSAWPPVRRCLGQHCSSVKMKCLFGRTAFADRDCRFPQGCYIGPFASARMICAGPASACARTRPWVVCTGSCAASGRKPNQWSMSAAPRDVLTVVFKPRERTGAGPL